ncbi:hypothetical protein [Infirmifilum uzonense]|uniref:hypothetical protein n=1 Tax=Infirmifilum uzonense TaxID=1550241 RepID=UPI00168CEF05|nr:hypothetical protein [Infirmifilum uzonense]
MARKALIDTIRLVILASFTITVLTTILLLVQGQSRHFTVEPSQLNVLAQATLVDLNSKVYINRTICEVKANNLTVTRASLPIIELEKCRITPLNESWLSIIHEGSKCKIYFLPKLLEGNNTLVLYDSSFDGFADRLCFSRRSFAVRVYDLSLSYCGRNVELEGPQELKVVIYQVNRC